MSLAVSIYAAAKLPSPTKGQMNRTKNEPIEQPNERSPTPWVKGEPIKMDVSTHSLTNSNEYRRFEKMFAGDLG
jgi:hypothetical protein